jgi:hypothetical protein
MRRIPGLLLERLDDHPLDIVVADRTRLTRTRLVMQTIKTPLRESASPLTNRRRITAQPGRDPPSAAANTTRQRNANACELFGRRAHRSSTSKHDLHTLRHNAPILVVDEDDIDASRQVPAN